MEKPELSEGDPWVARRLPTPVPEVRRRGPSVAVVLAILLGIAVAIFVAVRVLGMGGQ
jgi:hypothetical protein